LRQLGEAAIIKLFMRILIATFTYSPERNGVSMVAGAHANGFLELGHDVTICTGFAQERGGQREISGVPRVYQFKVSGSANRSWGFDGEIEEYRKFLAGWDGDVVMFHCWGIWSTDLAIPMLERIKGKKVLISHGFTTHRYPLNCRFPRGLRTFLGWWQYNRNAVDVMRHFDRVVFLADKADQLAYYDHWLAKKNGFGNISVISSGVDLEEFDEDLPDFREQFGLGSRPMALCVSNYFKPKNQLMALQAFAHARVQNAVMVFIGGNLNEYSRKLEEWGISHGMGDQILLLERIDRRSVCAAYKAADVVVCSSQWESGPLIVLEAMAARTPFVSTDVGFVSGLPGGLVVKSKEEMGDAIRMFLTDLHRGRAMGIEGRSACEKRFEWNSIISQYAGLLENLVSPKTAEK